jgi:hypothetical protein
MTNNATAVTKILSFIVISLIDLLVKLPMLIQRGYQYYYDKTTHALPEKSIGIRQQIK